MTWTGKDHAEACPVQLGEGTREMRSPHGVVVPLVFAGFVLATCCFADAIPADQMEVYVLDATSARVIYDGTDAAIRRTDADGEEVPVDMSLPEFVMARFGPWAPLDPYLDLYDGVYQDDGIFLCVEVLFEGLVNPPGPTAETFDPTLHGPCPVFGFVEFDIDDNVDTGGEMEAPEFRYLSNVARYGGMPVGPEFVGRVSTDGQDSDMAYDTEPWIDRSGEEFHLALFAEHTTGIVDLNGNQDVIFDEGETWILEGHFWHRAHGFDIFAYMGGYEPLVELRFAHSMGRDATTVTLVYPLTNEAYALATGQDPSGEDFDDFNANSIHEALWNLHFSALNPVLPGHPYEPLILGWADLNPDDYMNPRAWRPTFLFSTVLEEFWLFGGFYSHVDIWPNVVEGDFNGDGLAGDSDAAMVADFVQQHDGDPSYDADGVDNGVIEVAGFAVRFSIYDVDYNGIIDDYDRTFSLQEPGDYNNDQDVDFQDFAAMQRCFAVEQSDDGDIIRVGCIDAFDLDEDEDIDIEDFDLWARLMTGP